MFTFVRRFSSKFTWLSAVTIFCAFSYTANAQTQQFSLEQIEQAAAVAPYALFQYATLSGSGNTITAALVPVVTSTGATIYQNVTLQFSVAANGTLTVASTQIVPAPPLIVSSFQAGTYVGPSTIYSGTMIVNVSGPGTASGGATEWTLTAGSGANSCTYPGTATWYVGPLSTSPLAARLTKAGITSTAWSYGVASPGSCTQSGYWETDTLIGVSQVGNTLTIVSFSYEGNSYDYKTPQDVITYTKK